MKSVLACAAFAVLAPMSSTVAFGQARALQRRDVVRLVLASAGAVRIARARVAEARAERVGAAVLLTQNPSLAATAGPRWSAGQITPQLEVGIEQAFSLGGGRGARLDAARAGVDRSRAELREAGRGALVHALTAFVDALDAAGRLAINQEAEAVALELLAIAERREASGDVSLMDVQLARSSAARARAARLAAEASREGALGSLAAVLGLDEVVGVEGNLAEAPRYALDALAAAAARRPDLAALRAEGLEHEARLREGQATAWPLLTLGASYESDDGDDLVLGTVGITLPLFERGSGLRVASRARRDRARLAAAVTERSVRIELRGLLASYEGYRRALAAADESLEPLAGAAPLTLRAYQAGELSLGDVLIVRRELVDARSERLDRARDLALARVAIEYTAGVLR